MKWSFGQHTYTGPPRGTSKTPSVLFSNEILLLDNQMASIITVDRFHLIYRLRICPPDSQLHNLQHLKEWNVPIPGRRTGQAVSRANQPYQSPALRADNLFGKVFKQLYIYKRMHSSRMRTTRFSGHLGGGGGWGAVCPRGECLPSGGGVYTPCPLHAGIHKPPPPVDRIINTRLWKHYLPATTVAGGNNMWRS